jgi:hypothetical protein
MRFFRYLLLICFLGALTNCTIYRSPDRKDFESDSSQFHVQNLKASGCSATSVRSQAEASKLVTMDSKLGSGDSRFLWEYRIQDESVFESDNLKGVYCVFEKP